MSFSDLIMFLLSVGGHTGIWCAAFNQVHATRFPRWIRKIAEKLVYLSFAGLLSVLCLWMAGVITRSNAAVNTYICVCLAGFAFVLLRWLFRQLTSSPLAELRLQSRDLIDVGRELPGIKYSGLQARLLGMVPLNQSLKISVERRELRMEGWPAELDGMVIAHLTDFHFTGKICREYFERVVSECNAIKPDFVFVTGDIVDKVECIDWLPTTLGCLNATCGKYYILGNHDLRVKDEPRLRDAIENCGFVAAGGEWQPLSFNGECFSIAGDELPWFRGAENLPPAESPSVLLAHSPDRIFDAEKRNVDLVLAGHCHGGQIRLPIFGPIIAPSKHGVRFASGTFKQGRTLMHVSRGVSGDDPIRLNCPPELNVIEIRAGRGASG